MTTPSSGAGADPGGGTLSAEERQALLHMARLAVVRAAAGIEPPRLRPPTARLLEPQACFVTLTHGGSLRGCIGHVHPRLPLCEAVAENARCAALRDPRFRPVQPCEVHEIRIEISVLSGLRPLQFGTPEELLAQLHPFEDGLMLEVAGHSATLLPKVWVQLPDKAQFLEYLCKKGGAEPLAWRSPNAAVSVFQAESFGEPEN